MTLQNFEKQIDSTIIKRGKEYFKKGNIEFLEETKKGNWLANVSGTDDYNIKIEIESKNTIKKYFCDCPYDGSVCKHVVAVLYAISKENSTLKKVSPKTKQNPFDALLLKIKIDEYQNFIKHYSKINKSFKDEFELYFSEKEDSFDLEKKYNEIIKKTIKKHTSRGYIDYSASNKLGKEVGQYLNIAKQYSSKSNYKDAVIVYKILISELSKTFEYCDDSNGSVSDCVSVAIDELSEMINAPVSFEFKEKIADFLEKELKKSIYFDYGCFGHDLAEIYATFCIKINKIDQFISFIEDKIQSTKSDSYDRKFFIQTQIWFLSEIGRTDEVQKLTLQNLEIPEIRTLEINRMLENKEYETAKKLVEEGIKLAEQNNYSGTVYEFEKQLLAIAVLEKDINLERYFLRKFALGHTLNTTYYKQWKNTYSKEEWTKTIEEEILGVIKKINETAKKNMHYSSNSLNINLLYSLGSIYIEESYFDRLLILVQKQDNLSTILGYYPHLIKIYPNELLNLLIPVLEAEGDKCNDRNQYRDLANKMKLIIKDFPLKKERVLEVARKLKEKYPRRPAMQEELNELF